MIDELRTKKGLIISIMIFSLFEMIFVTSGAVGPKPNEEKIPSQIIRFLEEDSDSDSDETVTDLDLRFTEEEDTKPETETPGGTIKITVVETLTEEVKLFSEKIWTRIQSDIYIKIAGQIIDIKASEIPKLTKADGGKNVEILFKTAPKDLSNIFQENKYIKTLDLTLINATEITTMAGMCKGAIYMEEINLTGLKTNKLVSMKELCSGCTALKTVKISGFISTNVETMEAAFKDCSSLESLNLSSLKTPKVKSCKDMFSGCTKLKSINLSGFELGDSVDISGMFDKCDSLKEVTLDKDKNKKVADVLTAKGVKIIDVTPDSQEEEDTPSPTPTHPVSEDKIHFPKKSSGGLSAGAIAAIVAVCVVVVVIVVVIIVVVQAKVASAAGATAIATTSTVMSGTV